MGHGSWRLPVCGRIRPVASPEMTDLPSPPPVEPGRPVAAASGADGARPGDLTFFWRSVVAIAWLCSFFAYAAVWQASVQIGIATWWIGPRSSPSPALVRAIPFFVAIVGVMLAVYNVRRLASLSLGVATVSALVAVPDFSRSVGLAVVEATISVSMIVVSAAALTGRYRTEEVGGDRPAADGDRATAPATDTPPHPPPPPPPPASSSSPSPVESPGHRTDPSGHATGRSSTN